MYNEIWCPPGIEAYVQTELCIYNLCRGGWQLLTLPCLIQPAFFSPPAKYAKCDQCGNPKVSWPSVQWAGQSSWVLLIVLESGTTYLRISPENTPWPPSSAFLTQGNRCVFNLCRGCCKKRAFRETADCPGEQMPTVTSPFTLQQQWECWLPDPHSPLILPVRSWIAF